MNFRKRGKSETAKLEIPKETKSENRNPKEIRNSKEIQIQLKAKPKGSPQTIAQLVQP
jgi:hypothetical protein